MIWLPYRLAGWLPPSLRDRKTQKQNRRLNEWVNYLAWKHRCKIEKIYFLWQNEWKPGKTLGNFFQILK